MWSSPVVVMCADCLSAKDFNDLSACPLVPKKVILDPSLL